MTRWIRSARQRQNERLITPILGVLEIAGLGF
jgi:hypothetical protein